MATFSYMLLLSVTLDIFQTVILGKSGVVTNVTCSLKSNIIRWDWTPSFPVCSETMGTNIKIFDVAKGKVALKRFIHRLKLTENYTLQIRHPISSDSGLFTCVSHNGETSKTKIQIEPGCMNNVLLEKHSTSHSLTLKCSLCKTTPIYELDRFEWKLNNTPVTNIKGVTVSKNGDILEIQSTQKASPGKWICIFSPNTLWFAEYCMDEDKEDKEIDTGNRINGLQVLQIVGIVLLAIILILAVIVIAFLYNKFTVRKGETYQVTKDDNAEIAMIPSDASRTDPMLEAPSELNYMTIMFSENQATTVALGSPNVYASLKVK
ncbi:uncharacterized protein LOC114645600 [Erpetoichthys calabaricus]|uniref:uncharacterized protein LOC114645600 n=1 Tax=Erpetoichthys calabaricus TaxID=27687 RepID=UPI002234872B|nr:uncharacterized protein LOC114645600 [Erpetoichthys calabaricus]